MLFWVAAGRASSPASVAVASAAWSAATLAALSGSAGATSSLAMTLSRHERPRLLVLAYAVVAGAVSAVLSVPLSVWLLQGDSEDSRTVAIGIAVAATLLSVGAVTDGALIDQNRSGTVLLRNGAASLLKVPPVVAWPLSAGGLLAVSVGAVLTSIAISARKALVGLTAQRERAPNMTQAAWSTIVSNHVATVSLSAPALLAPTILIRQWGAQEFAPYFPTWIVLSTYTSGAISVVAAFLSHRTRGLGTSMRRDSALKAILGMIASVPLAGIALAGAPYILGSGYQGASASAVALLLAAAVGTMGSAGASAVMRSWGHLTLAAGVLLLGSAASTISIVFVAPQGPENVSIIYCGAQVTLAVSLIALLAALRFRQRACHSGKLA